MPAGVLCPPCACPPPVMRSTSSPTSHHWSRADCRWDGRGRLCGCGCRWECVCGYGRGRLCVPMRVGMHCWAWVCIRVLRCICPANIEAGLEPTGIILRPSHGVQPAGYFVMPCPSYCSFKDVLPQPSLPHVCLCSPPTPLLL